MSKLLIGAAAVAALAAGSAVIAQNAPMAPMPMGHAGMASRVMTRAEVQAHVAQMFARLDANRDGFVTKAEADAMKGQLHDHMGNRFKAPMPGAPGAPGINPAQAFDRVDANHDGVITRDEFAAAPHPGMQMMRVRMARGMGGMARMGGKMFERADANRDGRVSLAEAQTAALAHFDRADLNHDGQLTPQERQQAHQQMRAMRRAG